MAQITKPMPAELNHVKHLRIVLDKQIHFQPYQVVSDSTVDSINDIIGNTNVIDSIDTSWVDVEGGDIASIDTTWVTEVVGYDTTWQYTYDTLIDTSTTYEVITRVRFADSTDNIPEWRSYRNASDIDVSNIYNQTQKNGMKAILNSKWNQAESLLTP